MDSVNWLASQFYQLHFLFLKTNEIFFGCAFGIVFLLKCPSLFHLHHPGRLQQIFIKNILGHIAIRSSFNYVKVASTICWKAAPNYDLPTSSFWGDMQSVVCIMNSRGFKFGPIGPDFLLLQGAPGHGQFIGNFAFLLIIASRKLPSLNYNNTLLKCYYLL